MEASRARLELCSPDPQEVKGLEVDDVEAATTVHQHLGKSSVDDDGIDDEWVDTGADDGVWMVITVECDGGARPAEVLWHCHRCREDLPMFPLALSRRELCCGSAIDHVAVMDYKEPVVVLASTLVVTLVFLLIVLLQPQAVEILLQHVAVLEHVVGPSLVITARLFEHFVKNAPLQGASRLLSLDHGDKIVIDGLALVLSRLLLLVVVLLGSSTGALIIVRRHLCLTALVAKECANCLFATHIVSHYIHQLINGLWAIAPQLSHQVLTSGA